MGVKPTSPRPAAEALTAVPPDLWRIHGRLYDLAAFAGVHPGGRAALSLGRGDDCTLLFESYHLTSSRHRRALDAYLVPDGGRPAPPPPKLSPFHADAVAMLRAHFAGKGPAAHKAKTGHSALMLVFIAAYGLAWLGWARGSAPAAVALPFLAWLVM